MKALILAAGMGQRLGSLTATTPKALITVNDHPLLAHVLDFLRRAPEIQEIGVVGGYGFSLVKEWIAANAPDVKLMYNPHYTAGNLLTLCAAKNFVDDTCLLCNVDHLYRPNMLTPMLAATDAITAMVDRDRTLGDDDMKVATRDGMQLGAIHKTLTTYDAGYIGSTLIPAAELANYWTTVERTQVRHGERACVEWVLGELALAGHIVHTRDLSGFGWAEVDLPEERARAAHTVQTWQQPASSHTTRVSAV